LLRLLCSKDIGAFCRALFCLVIPVAEPEAICESVCVRMPGTRCLNVEYNDALGTYVHE